MADEDREPPRKTAGMVDFSAICLQCKWSYRWIGHFEDAGYKNVRKRPYDHARCEGHRESYPVEGSCTNVLRRRPRPHLSVL